MKTQYRCNIPIEGLQNLCFLSIVSTLFIFSSIFFNSFTRAVGKLRTISTRKSILCLLAEKVQAVNCEVSRQGERRGGAGEANPEHALFMNALHTFLHSNPKENL